MIVLNDEIQAAREGAKTSTLRLQTFRSPDFGALGHADADRVAFYRAPLRRHAPDTEFDVGGLDTLPRVDIVHAYAGADGAAVRACVDAGAQGIVMAGFAPGLVPPAQLEALNEAARAGVVVAHGSRVGSGRVPGAGRIARARQRDRRQPDPAEGPHPAHAGARAHPRSHRAPADVRHVLSAVLARSSPTSWPPPPAARHEPYRQLVRGIAPLSAGSRPPHRGIRRDRRAR